LKAKPALTVVKRPEFLSPYLALDLTGESGFLCGKILGDLGADVIKVEKPGGDPARGTGPFYQDDPHPEKSLHWFAYNNNKRGITLDLRIRTGQDLFRRLAERADFVIESFAPGTLRKWGLDYKMLSQTNRRLVMTSITPYGQDGPYKDYRASDLEIMAMSGSMSLAGESKRPPLRVSLAQSPMWAGSAAAMGTLFAHLERQASGEGQHVDVSAQASMITALAHAPVFWDVVKEIPQRAGVHLTGRSITGAKMRTIWSCKDGHVTFTIYGGPAGRKTNEALTAWMDSLGIAPEFMKQKEWEQFDVATITQEEVDCMEEAIAALFAMLTKKEFFEGVIAREMLGYPVATAADICEDPQLKARGFWQEIAHPDLNASLAYPGPFAQFSAGSCGIWRRAPRIGEHNLEVYQEIGLTATDLIKLKEAKVI
jgi:crotonobetainyl-CoA:carnitine CoA-transferase CaiB-like acyl-CoA transferase